MNTEPYDENNLAHQDPLVGVSQWQEGNEVGEWEEYVAALYAEHDAKHPQ